jgi:hypothetical protein
MTQFSMSLTNDSRKVLDRLSRGGKVVEEAAMALLRKSGLMILSVAKQRVPRNTSVLGNSLTATPPHKTGNTFQTEVGTNVKYGPYQEMGTGIYGPKRTPITPKKAKVLRFRVNGQWVSAKSVKGTKAKEYLKEGFESLQNNIDIAFSEADKVMQKL